MPHSSTLSRALTTSLSFIKSPFSLLLSLSDKSLSLLLFIFPNQPPEPISTTEPDHKHPIIFSFFLSRPPLVAGELQRRPHIPAASNCRQRPPPRTLSPSTTASARPRCYRLRLLFAAIPLNHSSSLPHPRPFPLEPIQLYPVSKLRPSSPPHSRYPRPRTTSGHLLPSPPTLGRTTALCPSPSDPAALELHLHQIYRPTPTEPRQPTQQPLLLLSPRSMPTNDADPSSTHRSTSAQIRPVPSTLNQSTNPEARSLLLVVSLIYFLSKL